MEAIDHIQPHKGIVTLTGYGLRIAVERGHLVVEDGIADERRRGRFSRVHKIHRLVVIGHTGTVSLEALRWMRDVGISFIQIDSDGQVIAAIGPSRVCDPRVLRGQVLAAENGLSLTIARQLVCDKLKGQINVLRRLPESKPAQRRIKSVLALIERSDSVEHLRHNEADAAKAYWQRWEQVGVGFGKRESKHLPKHWLNFTTRTSPHSRSPRAAVNPANAMLNYLYAILEAEARIACMAMGLDPGLGLYHADQRYRDSLACDLMEPVRPTVDMHLLQMLQTRSFKKADFFETRQGVCRVMPSVSRHLAPTAVKWSAAVAPVVERVAQTLASDCTRSKRSQRPLPTPLSRRNRSQSRHRLKELKRDRVERSASAKRAMSVREQHNAIRDWEATHHAAGVHHPEAFRLQILPHIKRYTLSQLADATGLSRAYCGRFRSGEVVPHPRHWKVLEQLSKESKTVAPQVE